MSHDPAYLRRWASSLRRTACATLKEAEAHGRGWAYYELSLRSARAQLRQAQDYDALADERENAPDA